MNTEKLKNKFHKNLKEAEEIVNHFEIYNLKQKIKKILINTSIGTYFVLPFCLTGCIMYNTQAKKNITPFKKEIKKEYCKEEIRMTSENEVFMKSSYDYHYHQNSLVFTTHWTQNDQGFFERTITYFDWNESEFDKESLLTATKEELSETYGVVNVEKITKKNLNEEDNLFLDKPKIVLTYAKENLEKYRERPKNDFEEGLDIFFWFISTTILGNTLRILIKIFTNDIGVKKLISLKNSYKLKKEDLEILRQVLEIRKQNMELLQIEPTRKRVKEDL